jgi:hypothetical protein
MKPGTGKGHRKIPRFVIESADQTAANYSQRKFVGTTAGPGLRGLLGRPMIEER